MIALYFFHWYNSSQCGEVIGMKTIKDINYLILKKVIEIILVFYIMFYSTSIWSFNSTQNDLSTSMTLSSLKHTRLQVKEPQKYSIYPMQNSIALQEQNVWSLYVNNKTMIEESYLLVLNLSKDSTIDYQLLNISLGKDIFSLSDLPMEEISNSYYFILDENTIKNMTKFYEIRIWLKAEIGNEMQAKKMNISFELVNGVASV